MGLGEARRALLTHCLYQGTVWSVSVNSSSPIARLSWNTAQSLDINPSNTRRDS